MMLRWAHTVFVRCYNALELSEVMQQCSSYVGRGSCQIGPEHAGEADKLNLTLAEQWCSPLYFTDYFPINLRFTTKPQHSFYFENSFYVFPQRNFISMIDVTFSIYTCCNYWTWMWRITFTRVKIAVTLSEGSHQESNQKCFFYFAF